mmetsp:Transcript_18249/g.62001  ORF Transcript_18249/g.62001 Transcript_18249/m.62001 type:complete len:97 (+) Transcript_18249:106-396(+)
MPHPSWTFQVFRLSKTAATVYHVVKYRGHSGFSSTSVGQGAVGMPKKYHNESHVQCYVYNINNVYRLCMNNTQDNTLNLGLPSLLQYNVLKCHHLF